jgi:hypothetical protein
MASTDLPMGLFVRRDDRRDAGIFDGRESRFDFLTDPDGCRDRAINLPCEGAQTLNRVACRAHMRISICQSNRFRLSVMQPIYQQSIYLPSRSAFRRSGNTGRGADFRFSSHVLLHFGHQQ